jgi:hypothetical protein
MRITYNKPIRNYTKRNGKGLLFLISLKTIIFFVIINQIFDKEI